MRSKPGERYRRSPYLVSYWLDSRLVFANYATGAFLTADPFTTQVLGFFDRWRSVAALERRFPEFTPASLRRMVRTLARHSLLQSATRGPEANERAMASWDTWNPAAGFFHFATKDIPYELDLEAVERDAAAVMLMTAVFPRNQWKYQHARAYRTVLLDAGHLCQTFCLTATWLGLAPFCTMALADSRIEKDLGLDGVTESVLYAAGVGTRPAGVEWAPWPQPRRR